MSWSGGTYSKGNAATGGWVGDASLGIGIEAGRHDTQDNDFATGINNCLAKDGQNAMTANLNFGGFLPTNVGAGTAAAPAFCAGNDPDTGMFYAAANQLGFATGGIERLRVDVSGRVGIGTTSPSSTLALSGTASAITHSRFSADGSGSVLEFRKSRNATIDTNTIVQGGDVTGLIAFSGANGTGYDPTAYIISRVDATPGATNDMPGRLEFLTTPDASATPVERMRIDSNGSTQLSGRLMFLTTTTASGTGIYASAANTLNFSTNSTSAGSIDASQFWYLAGSRNRTTAVAVNCVIDSTDGGIYRSTSSLKYKTDVRDYTRGLAELVQLRPVFYKGKTDGNTQFAGLIAEEVDAIGLNEFVQYAEDGTPDALAYTNMVALCVAAIKDLNVKVETLETKVQALEAVTAGL